MIESPFLIWKGDFCALFGPEQRTVRTGIFDMILAQKGGAYMFNPQYNQFAASFMQPQAQSFQPWGQSPQRTEIIKVNGQNGARAFQMAPNSSALLLDESAPIVWLVQTDGAGYKTEVPYSITPYQAHPEPDYNSLDERIKRLEEIINGRKPDTSGPKRNKQGTVDAAE